MNTTVEKMLAEIATLRANGFLCEEAPATQSEASATVDTLLSHHSRNIMFLVTEACNLHCKYCYEVSHAFHDGGRMMDTVSARLVIDEFVARSGGRDDLLLTFFGGEPLLNFRLIRDAVQYASAKCASLKKRVRFSITTNGTLLTPEVCDFLVHHRFAVMVSLDGKQEDHDRYRVDKQGNGTHHKVVEGIKRLLDKQERAGVLPLKIRATMTAENTNDREMREYFASLGNVRIDVGISVGTAAVKSSWDVTSAHYKALEKANSDLVDEMLDCANRGVPAPPQNKLLESLRQLEEFMRNKRPGQASVPKLCGVGRNMLAVTPTGDLFPCHRYVGMESFNLGNIKSGGPDGVQLKKYYGALFGNFLTHCTKCWMRFRCGGQCPWYLSTEHGEIIHPDEASCNSIRRSEEILVWLYVELKELHSEWLLKQIQVESIRPDDSNCNLAGSLEDKALMSATDEVDD